MHLDYNGAQNSLFCFSFNYSLITADTEGYLNLIDNTQFITATIYLF